MGIWSCSSLDFRHYRRHIRSIVRLSVVADSRDYKIAGVIMTRAGTCFHCTIAVTALLIQASYTSCRGVPYSYNDGPRRIVKTAAKYREALINTDLRRRNDTQRNCYSLTAVERVFFGRHHFFLERSRSSRYVNLLSNRYSSHLNP